MNAFDQLADVLSPPRGRRERKEKAIDRSRDHAVYAAPHRPIRPHAYSRPDDITTERVLRTALATASQAAAEARRGIPIALVAFIVTVVLGLGVVLVVR